MIFEKQPRESDKAFAAFSLYLSLGPERGLREVARKLDKSLTVVGKWSSKFDWPARVAAHAAHLAVVEREAVDRRLLPLLRHHEREVAADLVAAGHQDAEPPVPVDNARRPGEAPDGGGQVGREPALAQPLLARPQGGRQPLVAGPDPLAGQAP